jgi:threonine/homoserine/homoserine lactone efflux protein
MSSTVLMLFILTSFVAIATPGPTVLLALSNGARFGTRVALFGMLGAMLSDLILIGSVSIGLGAVLAASEVAFQVLKWIGVAYLVYLGVQLLRTQPQSKPDVLQELSPGPSQSYRLFLKCLLVALTNPKGYLFFSAILPQFVNPQAPQLLQYVLLALTFTAIDGLVMLGYASSGARAVKFFRTPMTMVWINRFSGGALITLAGALALYRRARD